MKIIFRSILFSAVCLITISACVADVGEDARKIAEANKDAVVTVQLVIETKMSYSGEDRKQERKVTAPATIIDPSGLAVASLCEIDPTRIFDMFESGETEGLKFSSNIVDMKIKTSEGDEIPADVVLRDKDLDLAFIKPRKAPETPMKFVDLSQTADPALMDELVILSRLGQVANRSLSVNLERVQSVITKPRTFYVINREKSGGPAFSLDGKIVGVLVMRAGTGDRSESLFPSSDDMLIVVLPCSTINKIAQQAKNAQPEKPAVEATSAKQPVKPPVKNPAKAK